MHKGLGIVYHIGSTRHKLFSDLIFLTSLGSGQYRVAIVSGNGFFINHGHINNVCIVSSPVVAGPATTLHLSPAPPREKDRDQSSLCCEPKVVGLEGFSMWFQAMGSPPLGLAWAASSCSLILWGMCA